MSQCDTIAMLSLKQKQNKEHICTTSGTKIGMCVMCYINSIGGREGVCNQFGTAGTSYSCGVDNVTARVEL